jgi:hypothetical protein
MSATEDSSGDEDDARKYPMAMVKNKNDKNTTSMNARTKRNSNRLRISLTEDCISCLDASTWLSIKFVAYTMHCNDQIIWFQLMTQVANVGIDGAFVAFECNTMYGCEQLIS